MGNHDPPYAMVRLGGLHVRVDFRFNETGHAETFGATPENGDGEIMSEIKLCECGCGQSTTLATHSSSKHGVVKGQSMRFIRGHRGRGSFTPNPVEHRLDGTTVIFLKHKGETLECIISTQDYETVKGHHWSAMWREQAQTFYAYTNSARTVRTTVYMHCLLVSDTPMVDHKNHNGLDNRVYDAVTDTGNIRPATIAENVRNRRKSTGKSSVFKGVSWDNQHHKWRARIKVNYKDISLGMFDSELEASFAYAEAAKKHHGEFACVESTRSEVAN
jgi:hypothetical protein